MRRTSGLLTLAALAAALLVAAPADAPAQAGPGATVTGAAPVLRALARQTKALPRKAGKAGQRRRLRARARRARRAALRRPCVAVRSLAAYRRTLRRTKARPGARKRRVTRRLAVLGPRSLEASRLLLRDPRTRRCGGGVTPSTASDATATVLESTTDRLRVRVQMPRLRFVPRTGGGRAWTQLTLPKTDSPGAPGTPGIPVVSNTFGVPDGASLAVDAVAAEKYVLDGVDVFPAQPDPVDQDTAPPDFFAGAFADAPFTLDRSAYARRGSVPAEPADANVIGTSRDLTLGTLQLPAVQYDAARRRATVLDVVDVTIRFEGGTHAFSPQLDSPWEQPQRRLVAALLNAAAIRGVRDLVYERCGEEMLVITNPATRPAANAFAAARRAAGIRTSVFDTGTGTGQIGDTAAAIQTFIRSRLNQLRCIRPSYVTIMGDDDLVPTFPGINGIASDLQYSMRDDADELPDVAVGRIIGDDQAGVGAAVTKIVDYENGPPGGLWLSQATIAAQFQDDNLDGTENRTFTRFAEVVRTGLVARGVGVDRIYDDSPTATPLKFDTGEDLPDEIKKPGFAWDGDGADVAAAWNQGRFMVLHRDHGWNDGWGHPQFTTADVDALTNGAELPVVLSINCSSGAFDFDDTSFATRALVNPNGGAVGVFGDTRDSPSWHNTQIAWGFVDGLLPSVLPTEGPATAQRTGDALINGKLRLAGLAPPSGPGIVGGDGSTRNELYLWHYFGDPSMQMFGGGPPRIFDPALFDALVKFDPLPGPDPPPYSVVVNLPLELQGQPVSLLRDGQVIGKAIAGAGQVTIPAAFDDGAPRQGELQVAMEADGATPVVVPVQVPAPPPPPPPPPEKVQTSLTLSGPERVSQNQDATFGGTLAPGFAGAEIRIVYRREDPQAPGGAEVVEGSATTDADGEYEEVRRFEFTNPNEWTAQAFFDGDDEHVASQSEVIEFVVDD